MIPNSKVQKLVIFALKGGEAMGKKKKKSKSDKKEKDIKQKINIKQKVINFDLSYTNKCSDKGKKDYKIDVNCNCDCGAKSGKSSGASSGSSSKASSGKTGGSGLGKFADVVSNIANIAGKASNFGLMAANIAKDIGSSIVDMVNKTAEASNQIKTISEATGLSTTQLQELKYAASQTGVEFSNIQNAALSMADAMAVAGEGNNAQSEAFQQLGISLQDTQGNLLSTDEVFNQTLMKLAGMADETERNSLAAQLFGSSATELTPLLEAGGEGLQGYKDRAHELGLVMSGEVIDSNAKFSESLGAMKETIGNLKEDVKQAGNAILMKLGTALIPIFQNLLDWVSSNMPVIQETISTVFGYISDSVGFFIGLIQDLITWIQSWAGNNEETLGKVQELFTAWFEAIKAEIQFFIDLVTGIWEEYGDEITAIFKAIWDYLVVILNTAITIITDIFNVFKNLFKGDWDALWNSIKHLFSDIWEGISNILGQYIESIKTVVTNGLNIISDIFDKIWGGIKDTVKGVWDGIFNTINNLIDSIKTVIKNGLEFISDKFEKIWNGIKNTVDSVWDGIVNGIKGAINVIIKAINSMIRGMNKLKFNIPDWVPIIGGKTWGLNIREIPLLAKGTDYFSGGLAIIGERGPELVELPRGARVFSNSHTQDILGKSGITQHITINSPIALSPSEIKRKTLDASRQLAMEWGV